MYTEREMRVGALIDSFGSIAGAIRERVLDRATPDVQEIVALADTVEKYAQELALLLPDTFDTERTDSHMNLKVTPFHPGTLTEDPVYRFTVVENDHQVAHLFNVPVSRLRANGGQHDYEKVAIQILSSTESPDFSMEVISGIVVQLREAFRGIVA